MTNQSTDARASGNDNGDQALPVHILLYDGVCGFCHSTIQTILRFDRTRTLHFASLDSPIAAAVIGRHPELHDVDSVVLVDQPGRTGERVYVRSAAVLQLLDYLGGPWKGLLLARLIPRPTRDWLYDQLAHVRYRLFGRFDACPVPPPHVRARFLD